MISHKAFVVIDIPEPHQGAIQRIRDQLKTITAKLPVEITVAGSSGVGPIPAGTTLSLIRGEVDRVARSTVAFQMEFAGVGCFPNTGVFFLSPKDRKPFDALHASLTASKIPFTSSPFPYNPHCTLRVGPPVEPSLADHIFAIAVPSGEQLLESVSVYGVDDRTFAVTLLHRTKLGK